MALGTGGLGSRRVPKAIEDCPSACLEAEDRTSEMAACQRLRDGIPAAPGVRVLCDQDSAIAVLHAPRGNMPSGETCLGAILALARSLGLEVGGEGIETEQQLRILRDMGCVYGLGYFFGRPKSADYWIALQKNGAVTTQDDFH